ncbi:30S ribosomal protein S18 [Clostridium novyi B str. ATCC 27606]|uniref:[Ribosomal protein bS18]-alanine N-acetyltransferase n=1 Tax=Clostridium novyi B str. ATCC 27606 TaxID=1443123 RepID=A0AA40M6B4_CLONO|nr:MULTISPECIES: ribosomal protein S18-alanine N-acetyltransferase [Clostridium]KEI13000.1 30S ribosomal protein S18 [Clostridium novyi B str. NCTC 9691]KEI17740.1 30S ribosomal protein S18 [Clostridium novyi B str. ATCC 27606]CAG7839329.1 [Ribosomal protein S18]-alanine N-acetyltransferase [Clostridium haemolyticum]
MNNLSLQEMKEEDLESVLKINNICFNPPWKLQTLKNEFRNNFSKYIVLKDQHNKIIGYAGIWLIIDEAHITNIAVHPDYRGLGASNYLMNGIMDICTEKKIPAITLEVRENNTVARNLYKKYGFLEEGLRKNYYGPNVNALVMWKKDVLE